MTMTPADKDTATMAKSAAPHAADVSVADAPTQRDVQIRELHDLEDAQGLSSLFDRIWDDPGETLMPVNLVRALEHAGNYVAGAFISDALVGGIIGFVGLHDGEVILHSHILGVLPETRGVSVGYALKQHQRVWCLDRGITTVTWTFDPLVRRNAFFNLSKLRAVGAGYESNYYGTMADAFNANDESDRLFARWRLSDERVAAAAVGTPGLSQPRSDEGTLLQIGADGDPVQLPGSGDTLHCQIPADIIRLRAETPREALRWRHALRDTLGAAVSDGYEATDMDRNGWYTLTRKTG